MEPHSTAWRGKPVKLFRQAQLNRLRRRPLRWMFNTAQRSQGASPLKLMNEASITALFMVEDGRPVDVLHVHHLLRAG